MRALRLLFVVTGALALGFGMVLAVSLWMFGGGSPEEALAETTKRLSGVSSASFTMRMTMTSDDAELSMEADGVLLLTGDARFAGTITAGTDVRRFEEIITQDAVYLRLPPDERWYSISMAAYRQPGSSPLGYGASPGEFLDCFSAFDGVEETGRETVDGRPCRRYRLTIDLAALTEAAEDAGGIGAEQAALVQEIASGSEMLVEAWIAEDDLLPVREEITMQVRQPFLADVHVIIDFTSFNDIVEVQPPRESTPLAIPPATEA
ncbi:MAG: hypothetical protein IBX62_09420 [Coriobacteriia bacterium]|nr:hypothetical protein [Coriobacteriia bacterium]